jgi:hypothetical protein
MAVPSFKSSRPMSSYSRSLMACGNSFAVKIGYLTPLFQLLDMLKGEWEGIMLMKE